MMLQLLMMSCAALASEPDLIFAHGKIFLGPGRYAQAAAVAGNRIAAVGADAEVLPLRGPRTRLVDLKGRAVTPGFHDADTRFFDGAQSLVPADLKGGRSSRELRLTALRQAIALASQDGVTAVDSMPGLDGPTLEESADLWRELYRSTETTVRCFLYGKIEDPAGFASLKKSAGGIPRDRLDFAGLAVDVDGTLEDRTASLFEPYFDAATNGVLKHPASALDAWVQRAHRRGFQVALRAAGDRAVRAALDACGKSEEKARLDELVLPSFPCRLERVEVISPQDIPRFSALRAVVSMLPNRMVFEREEQNYHPNRLGSRVDYSFAWKSLEDAKGVLAFGSGWPAGRLAPRYGLFASVTRRHLDGKPPGGWIPQERISLESAVLHSTLDPARAVGHDAELGSIFPGKLADLVVFDRDLFAASGLDLLEVRVDMTVFDGKVVFERRSSSEAKP